MARQGLMDDSGYDFFDASDCSNYEKCSEEAYNDGYSDAIDEFVKYIDKHSHITKDGCEVALDDDITILAEQFKEQNND